VIAPPATLRGMDLTDGSHMSETKLHLKNHIFHMTSNEDNFYMKIVDFGEIYNFLFFEFFSFETIKMLKKYKLLGLRKIISFLYDVVQRYFVY
jgi:hypothetical protein